MFSSLFIRLLGLAYTLSSEGACHHVLNVHLFS